MNETPDVMHEPADPTGSSAAAYSDPWDSDDQVLERRDNWLLSYIDILTLFLTLLVVLLALQPKAEAPLAETQPGDHRFISPIPIDRPAANALSRATETGTSTLRWPDAGMADSEQQAGNRTRIEQPGIPVVSQLSFNTSRVGFPESGIPLLEGLAAASAPAAPAEPARNEPRPPGGDAGSGERKADAAQRLIDEIQALELDRKLRVSQIAEGVQLEVSDTILFALGSTDLKPEGRALLDELHLLFSRQQGKISIEGHTDDRPIANLRFPSNWELSSGRATQVARYLISKGMAPARLRAIGYADTRPLQSNATAAGRSRNRRVALLVELSESTTRE